MCVVCGCTPTPPSSDAPGAAQAHGHSHDHGHDTRHGHSHGASGHVAGHVHQDHAHDGAPELDLSPGIGAEALAVNPQTGDLHYGAGSARVSVPGMSQARAIKIETDVLGANNRIAAQNRAHFEGHGVTAYNLVSSPGSGKTTLLCATIEALKQRAPHLPLAVIEGDQQTSNDADRIRATGAAAIQVNTGKGCHLDAQMVADAYARLPLHDHAHAAAHDEEHTHGHGEQAHTHDHDHSHEHPEAGSLLLIENVGNLVCPAMWDLGERAKVAILSITEGEDKPIKYPDMFAAAQVMVLTKTDLLPHLDFDVNLCIDYARRVNPGIEVLQLSARSGAGMDAWLDWLLQAPTAPDGSAQELARLRARVAELEKQLAAQAGVPNPAA